MAAACVKVWADECVVYDRESGDTHHLGPHATGVLNHLVSTPGVREPDLLWAVEPALPDITSEMVGRILEDLERLGLAQASD